MTMVYVLVNSEVALRYDLARSAGPKPLPFFYYCPICLRRWGTVAVEGEFMHRGWMSPCGWDHSLDFPEGLHYDQFWTPLRSEARFIPELVLGFANHVYANRLRRLQCPPNQLPDPCLVGPRPPQEFLQM